MTPRSGPAVNVQAGFAANVMAPGIGAATIAGGGGSGGCALADPCLNQVTGDYGTVAGGGGNRAGDVPGSLLNLSGATVGGGRENTAGGQDSTVAGGTLNTATGFWATVGGGAENTASRPGHAMRVRAVVVDGVPVYPGGAILGKALEPLAAGTGLIRVLVLPR